MKVRLHGIPAEVEWATRLLTDLAGTNMGEFDVVSVSEPYPDRGRSSLVRVYLELRLTGEARR